MDPSKRAIRRTNAHPHQVQHSTQSEPIPNSSRGHGGRFEPAATEPRWSPYVKQKMTCVRSSHFRGGFLETLATTGASKAARVAQCRSKERTHRGNLSMRAWNFLLALQRTSRSRRVLSASCGSCGKTVSFEMKRLMRSTVPVETAATLDRAGHRWSNPSGQQVVRRVSRIAQMHLTRVEARAIQQRLPGQSRNAKRLAPNIRDDRTVPST